ncbi:hypothetical protein [Paucilactobacillus oligofermentans]|nr:hypothetical protein [Paucilactobacillus oligofermentans]
MDERMDNFNKDWLSKSEDFGNPDDLRDILKEIKMGTIELLNDPECPQIYELEFMEKQLLLNENEFFEFIDQSKNLSTEFTKIKYVFFTKLNQGIMYYNGNPIEVNLNNLKKPIHLNLSKYRKRGIKISLTMDYYPNENIWIQVKKSNQVLYMAFKLKVDAVGDLDLIWNKDINKSVDIENFEEGLCKSKLGPWLVGNTLVCGEIENDELTGVRLIFNINIKSDAN